MIITERDLFEFVFNSDNFQKIKAEYIKSRYDDFKDCLDLLKDAFKSGDEFLSEEIRAKINKAMNFQ